MDQNNLTALNDVLFTTLKGIQDGTVDDKKAQTITNVANSIINNTKTQLQAYKLTKGMAFRSEFGKPDKQIQMSNDVYEQKSEFAIFKGYKNVSEAISGMGANFNIEFNKWIKGLQTPKTNE